MWARPGSRGGAPADGGAGTAPVVGVPPLYETEPVGGPGDQGPFLNLVVELSTSDTPRALLERCRALEAAAGRGRTVRWGPRPLAADVLWVGGWRGEGEDP